MDAITRRDLQPGERILEGEMASSLGVAKTTLREALKDLEHQGVVTKTENRGTYVTKLSVDDIRHIYELRIKLEPDAGVLAQRRMTSQDLSELENLIGQMRAAGNHKNYLNAQKADLAFHQLIWKISGNRALEKALNVVSIPMFAFSGLYLLRRFAANPSDYRRICDDHVAMVEALKTGPSEHVEKVFKEKLGVFKEENLAGANAFDSDRSRHKARPVETNRA